MAQASPELARAHTCAPRPALRIAIRDLAHDVLFGLAPVGAPFGLVDVLQRALDDARTNPVGPSTRSSNTWTEVQLTSRDKRTPRWPLRKRGRKKGSTPV
jgi:hypothetical protein